ncbi:MAG: pantoate--beta-alanine ligase [Nitrospirae bacterium]|nr:pantoate--beta-alanine ligase [Nitrospirota bacterium]
MQIIHSAKDMHSLSKLLRVSDKSIGFVPTMGALHEGHLSLVRRSKEENEITVVSIFVNPAQFGPNEDFEKYPRHREKDLAMLSSVEVDTVFMPEREEMCGKDETTSVDIGALGNILCGVARPGHFNGVATIVAKLFNIVSPDNAYFGQKDFQQCVIIKKMVTDLKCGVNVIMCPTVREADGLAMSSRNVYLTEPERKASAALYKALCHGREFILSKRPSAPSAVQDEIEKILKSEPLLNPEYIEMLKPENLEPTGKIELPVVICLAARIGKARLIDNILVKEEPSLPDDCAL